MMQVRAKPLLRQVPCHRLPEETDPGGDPPLLGRRRHVGGRLDAQHRDAPLHEVLEEVAVVAGQLDHQAVRSEAEALGGHPHVRLGVPQPAVGVRGEVRVVAEDDLGLLELLELDEEAVLAHPGVQRIEHLSLSQLLGLQVRVGQRRHAQVHDGPRERRAAEAARRCVSRDSVRRGDAGGGLGSAVYVHGILGSVRTVRTGGPGR